MGTALTKKWHGEVYGPEKGNKHSGSRLGELMAGTLWKPGGGNL